MDILGLIAIAKAGSISNKIFHFKGIKSSVSILPIQGEDGDVYKVEDSYYAWNGIDWINIGNILGVQGIEDVIDNLEDVIVLLSSKITNTTQTITFNSNGDIISIVHNRNNLIVRTDTFTWNTNSVVERRELTDGKYIIITTNLNTFETIISDIQEAI